MSRIWIKALGAITRDDELLVYDVEGNDCGGRNYRLLGGTVEFAEHSRETLHREFDEELGVSLTDVGPVGTYERVFTDRGEPQHEIWRVYAAEIVEDWPYERDEFTVVEPALDIELTVSWQPIPSLLEGPDSLYGAELLDDLDHSAQ